MDFLLRLTQFLLLIICSYFLAEYLYSKHISKKIRIGINNYIEREQNYKIRMLKEQYYLLNQKKFVYIGYLRKLIVKAAVRSNFINPPLIIVLNVLSTFVFYNISKKIIGIFPTDLLIGVFGFFLPQIVLKILAIVNSGKTDKLLIDYINLLINFCGIKDDIVYAIENASKFIADPLKLFSEEFVFEVRHGITPYNALMNLSTKIENDQFKFICKSLALASKNSNNFNKILNKQKDTYMDLYEKEMEKKNEAIKGCLGIVSIGFFALIIVFSLTLLNVKLQTEIKMTTSGNIIATYIAASIIFTITLAINSLNVDS